MFRSIWDDFVLYFRSGNMIVRLILFNVIIFLLVNIIGIFLNAADGLTQSQNLNYFLRPFMMNTDLGYFITHPWGMFTYMFLHTGFWHLFGNMLMLYFFGRIPGDLIGDDKVLPIYVLGGVVGALLDLILTLIIPAWTAHPTLGASGAVLALVVAGGFLAPEYPINLIIVRVRLKFIVGAIILMNLIGASSANASRTGFFVHLGGIFMGWLFIYLLRNGRDLSVPFNSVIDFFKSIPERIRGRAKGERPRPRVAYKNEDVVKKQKRVRPTRVSETMDSQERIDVILEKIKRKGIKSLTDEERSFLQNFSNKID